MSQFDSAVSSHLNKSLKSPKPNSWTRPPRLYDTTRADDRTSEFQPTMAEPRAPVDTDNIGGDVYEVNKFTFNPGDPLIRTNTLDDLMVTSPVKKREEPRLMQQVMQMKRRQEMQKQAKREAGEKKTFNNQTLKKEEASDDDIRPPTDEEEERERLAVELVREAAREKLMEDERLS